MTLSGAKPTGRWLRYFQIAAFSQDRGPQIVIKLKVGRL